MGGYSIGVGREIVLNKVTEDIFKSHIPKEYKIKDAYLLRDKKYLITIYNNLFDYRVIILDSGILDGNIEFLLLKKKKIYFRFSEEVLIGSGSFGYKYL